MSIGGVHNCSKAFYVHPIGLTIKSFFSFHGANIEIAYTLRSKHMDRFFTSQIRLRIHEYMSCTANFDCV